MIQKRYTQNDIQFEKSEMAIAVVAVVFFFFLLFYYFEPIQSIAYGGLLLLFAFFVWLFGRGKRKQDPEFLYELRKEDIILPVDSQKNLYIPYNAIEDVYVDKAIGGHSFWKTTEEQNENYFIRLVIEEEQMSVILPPHQPIQETAHIRNGKIDNKSIPVFAPGFSKKQLEKMAEEIRENIQQKE